MRFNREGLYQFLKTRAKKLLTSESKYGWFGDYGKWELAKQATGGYDTDIILEKVKNSLLKVRDKEAVYERDSVLFDEIQYSWGALAGLLGTALKNDGKLQVLDFGGSLGSSYFQNRKALAQVKDFKWSILEQHHFVDCGKANFQNSELFFYHDYEEFIAVSRKPDVLLISSVIQYLDQPYAMLGKLLANGIETVIIDITTFINADRDIITIQKVPPVIYEASYPTWFFNKDKFINFFVDNGYEKMGEWKLPYDINMGYHGGIIFNKK